MTADMVNHPPHYNSHPSGVECITITEHFNFLLGSAIKYIWRADDKGNPIQDLEKAVWYVQRELGRRRLLELEAAHEEMEVEFPALRDFADAGGLSNPNGRNSTAEVLRDPHNWPAMEWDLPDVRDLDLTSREMRVGDFLPDINVRFRDHPIDDPGFREGLGTPSFD